jgi:hypothetical protein
MLVSAGIAPICGAALPDGPKDGPTACEQSGISRFASHDGTDLHFDHEPPLEDWERSDDARVCDPRRIRLRCLSCHTSKTARENARGGEGSGRIPPPVETAQVPT